MTFTVQAGHGGWHSPPPEFPDTTDGSGLFAPIHTWEPRHGEPEGLLDVLPPGSPAIADVNHDGFPDGFVPNPGYTNDTLQELREPRSRLFVNVDSDRTTETFHDVTDVSGIDVTEPAYTAAWGDATGDGWEDLLVAGYGFATLYEHNGNATFTDTTDATGIPQDGLVLGAAWGDADADGDLDLFLARYTPTAADGSEQPVGGLDDQPGVSNVLLENDGDGTFTPVSEQAGIDAIERRSTTASFVDVDTDGHLDVYVTNHGQPNTYWHNDGDGTFTEQAAQAGVADPHDNWCQAWADFDRDGRLDLYTAREAGVSDGLFLTNGTDGFSDRSGELGLDATERGTGWGCAALDYDNDADTDLAVAHSNTTGDQEQRPLLLRNLAYENDGELGFVDNMTEAGDGSPEHDSSSTFADARAASGLAVAELNLDDEAALDLVTTNHALDRARVFRSIGWAGGWSGGNGDFLRVHLQGTSDNALGLGATVELEAGELHLTRQAGAGASMGTTTGTSPLLFGLSKYYEQGFERSEDITLTVTWPNGDVDRYNDTFSSDAATRLVQGQGYENDTLAPRPILSLVDGEVGNPGWYTSPNVTLAFTAEDEFRAGSQATGVASLAYSYDGEDWTTVDPDAGVELTFEGEGTHPLWLRTTDEAGNTAVVLRPVRIDATPPTGEIIDPAPGAVYVQGEEISATGDSAGSNRAIVLAPRSLDGVAGEQTQPVRTNASDEQGIRSVSYQLVRGDQRPVEDHAAETTRAPYLWAWPAHEVAAGEYTLETTIEDLAGNTAVLEPRVLVLPTTYAGLNQTAEQGPSPPRPT